MAKLTHYNPVLGNENINVQFWLAQTKAKILISGFKFTYDEGNKQLESFFNILKQHNDFEKLLWTTEIMNSVYGKSYIYFDMLANSIPKIGIYENNSGNSCLRVDGLTPIFVKGSRKVLSGSNGINAKIWEFRTPHSVKRLLQSGSSFNQYIPLAEAGQIETPEVVKSLLKIGDFKQDFVAMSAMEILNKDVVDFFSNNQEEFLADDFNVRELRNYINHTYQWGLQELVANHTRIIGDFSNQDLSLMEDDYNVKAKNPWDNTESFGNEFLKKVLFVRTKGNDSRIEVQQTNLDVEKQVSGLNKIIDLYFQGCGLDSALVLDGSGQKSVAEVQTTYKTTFETIKKTNQLRTKQWTTFIENMMIACGLQPNDFEGKWKFEIVSEILNDKLDNPETILQLHSSMLMTTKQALSKLYKDFTREQINVLEEELQQEAKQSKGGGLNELETYANIEDNQDNPEQNVIGEGKQPEQDKQPEQLNQGGFQNGK